MEKRQDNKTTIDFLNLALDMEDKMSKNVYEEYLDKSAWPSQVDEEIFEKIVNDLTFLIKETERHIVMFSKLKEKLK